MRDLKFDDWVGEVKAAMGPRKLELFNAQSGKSPRPMMDCAVEMRVCVKSQIMGARMELGSMRMSKSRRTAKLRTSISQEAYLVGCSQEVVTMDLRSCASWQATV